MRPLALLLLAVAALASSVAGIIISAPSSCGGSRVLAHATAKFGPPLQTHASFIPLYAPRPQGEHVMQSRIWIWPFRSWRARAEYNAITDGCVKLDGVNANGVKGHVVLVARGQCDFATKVQLLEEVGAVGVIVVNVRNTGQLVNMKLNLTRGERAVPPIIGIPAVMIRYSDWRVFAPCRNNPLLTVSMVRDGQAVYDIEYGRDALNWALMRGMALWLFCHCFVEIVRYRRRVATSSSTLSDHAPSYRALSLNVPPLVLLILAAAFTPSVSGIIVSAPSSCGGTRVLTHAGAKFGPPLLAHASSVNVFAPHPREEGVMESRAWLWPFRFWHSRRDRSALMVGCAPLRGKAAMSAVGCVVIVTRGHCDFARKVRLLEEVGAVGVIVVNARETGQLVNMKLNETLVEKGLAPKIGIPTVMIRYSDWRRFAPCRNNPLLTVSMVKDGQAIYDIDYGRDALNWAMMRGVALWILCQCGVNVVRYKRRVSDFRARATVIAALPEEVFQSQQCASEDSDETDSMIAAAVPSASAYGTFAGDEDPMCTICLDEVEPGQHIRRLACNHMYHRKCIDPWLQSSSNSCPICKREVRGLPPPPSQSYYGSMRV